jgi:hypothetical protein
MACFFRQPIFREALRANQGSIRGSLLNISFYALLPASPVLNRQNLEFRVSILMLPAGRSASNSPGLNPAATWKVSKSAFTFP